MTKAPRKKPKKEEEISLDDVPFVGGLFKGIEKLVDLAERVEQAGGEIKRSGTLGSPPGRHKDIRGVYGFTVRTGIGQKAKVERFGNIKKTKKGPKLVETREPMVDVFDEKEYVLVIVELPGVPEKSLKLDFKKDIVFLSAGNDDRKYAKEILLLTKVDFESREESFKNGILKMKFKKVKRPLKPKTKKSPQTK